MPPPRIPFLSYFRSLSAKASPFITNFAWKNEIITFGKVFITWHLFTSYIANVKPTEGVSMVPTIYAERWKPVVLESRLHRRGRNIRVGDVITFTHPIRPKSSMAKRVIGMPGDYVSVLTPGRKDEDLEKRSDEGDWASVREELVQVPEGHCWVAGDNLEWSRDSRSFGALPLGLVRGKALAVVWPYSARMWLSGEQLRDVKEGEHEWISRRATSR